MIVADLMDSYVALLVVGSIYFLPTLLAFGRNVPSPWMVAVLNLFLGWTLIGWVVALAMSAREPKRKGAPRAEAPDAPR